MAEEWLTYSELGDRLGVSPEAARQKAMRLRLRRQTANDGKAQVLVDLEDMRPAINPRKPKAPAADDRPTPDEPTSDTRTITALEAHIETLKTLVAKAEIDKQAERDRADNERDRADVERGRADVERERANDLLQRIESLIVSNTEHAENERQTDAELARLKMVLEEMRRPWWRRLVG